MSGRFIDNEKCTKTITVNYKRYCIYCGKEIEDTGYYEDCDYVSVYKCDCEDATKEHEINTKIAELKRQYPEPKYTSTTKVEHVITKI